MKVKITLSLEELVGLNTVLFFNHFHLFAKYVNITHRDKNLRAFINYNNIEIYDEHGTLLISSIDTVDSGSLTSEQQKEIIKKVNSFINGKIDCSNCSKQTLVKTPNRYMAGIYCDSCWQKLNMEEKRRNETYD